MNSYNFKFINILIYIIFSILFLIIFYSAPIHGPWDEYHLLYSIKNHSLFPLYDMNFPYYDTFSLGRFSPLAGQEFNLPIIFNLSLDNFRYFLFFEFLLLIYLASKLFNKNYFLEFKPYHYLLFLILIILSPGFIITSTRFLYSEDFLSLLIITFFILYCSHKYNNKFSLINKTALFFILFIILLYKESSFIFFSSFFFLSIFFDYRLKKINYFDIILFLLCIIYISIYYYVRSYFLGDYVYANPENILNLKNIFFTFARFFLNDIILFLILIPSSFIYIIKNDNNFYKAIFISSVFFIIFYIFLGIYSPYYLFPIYFLLIPIFFEFINKINFKNKFSFMIFTSYLTIVIFFSFMNSLFYYKESRALSFNFQNSLELVYEKIKKNNDNLDTTNIFICGNHDSGYLSQIYIFGEHLKFKNLSIVDFDFKSFERNNSSNFYTKNSPFDKIITPENSGYYSIFNNTNLGFRPTKNDIFLSLPYMSLNIENTCHGKYMDLFDSIHEFESEVRVTLLSNMLNRILIFNNYSDPIFFKKNYNYIVGFFK